jgi:hypothetical protein
MVVTVELPLPDALKGVVPTMPDALPYELTVATAALLAVPPPTQVRFNGGCATAACNNRNNILAPAHIAEQSEDALG